MTLLQYGMPLKELHFDKTCKVCVRGEGNAIPGCIQNADLSKLKLVVISDYPGHYEDKEGYCFYDNEPDRQSMKNNKKDKRARLKIGWPNAGNYIRRKLETLGLNTYQEVYFTNVLKCKQNNADKEPNETREVKRCIETWLLKELDIIEMYNPTVPILLLGKYAFIAFKKFIPHSPISDDKGEVLRKYRRQVVYYKNHPVITTVNPAAACSSIPKLEYVEINNINDLKSVRELKPPIGSPDWHFTNDLEPLKLFLNYDDIDK